MVPPNTTDAQPGAVQVRTGAAGAVAGFGPSYSRGLQATSTDSLPVRGLWATGLSLQQIYPRPKQGTAPTAPVLYTFYPLSTRRVLWVLWVLWVRHICSPRASRACERVYTRVNVCRAGGRWERYIRVPSTAEPAGRVNTGSCVPTKPRARLA